MRTSIFLSLLILSMLSFQVRVHAQEDSSILIKEVRVFDGKSQQLTDPVNILISGDSIEKMRSEPIDRDQNTKTIEGKGKTLMPGLIDVHAHMVLEAFTVDELLSPDFSEDLKLKKVGELTDNILHTGFTSVRDMGGPVFPIKEAIDTGKIEGPRIWPSGAFVSQTAGHGDFRTPDEKSRRFFGEASKAEKRGITFIADGRAEVLTAVRENLRFGASQIKLMAGGGTSSDYDPLDVTQYTLDEMKAAVQAADDWGTYVAVHAYTTNAVQRAIKAGVKSIEHGQLVDEETLEMMADKDVWLSTQNLMDNTPDMSASRIKKRAPILKAQKKIWSKAKKHNVKIAWGTDFLFNPELYKQRNDFILKLQSSFSNAEILKMVTHDNAELLQLSGKRSPYPGKLGVIEEGALADVLLVKGNPLENLSLIANPDKNFALIIKGGEIYKNKISE